MPDHAVGSAYETLTVNGNLRVLMFRQRAITDGTTTTKNNFGAASALIGGFVISAGYLYNQDNGKAAFVNVE